MSKSPKNGLEKLEALLQRAEQTGELDDDNAPVLGASGRGGYRPGSGPKPKPDTRMVTRAFVIRQDQTAWLYARASDLGLSQSSLLRDIISDEMSRLRVLHG